MSRSTDRRMLLGSAGLDISTDGGRTWSFADGTYLSDGTGYAHTSGWLTRSDPNYVFRASYDSNCRAVNPYVQSGVR
ncbi:hypothetical protein ACFWWC_31785 [Streptomyces sp. NPDC058642]|uniref:hypothetical protein n=1 Tax=Streptomyces sp. NPDC058642 TaxID=3346572 RepID=UPI00365F0808